MKILIITHIIPYPLSDGGKISQYSLIDYLRNKCSITLVVFVYNETDNFSIQCLKNIWENVNFEIISMLKTTPLLVSPTNKCVLQIFLKAILYKANWLYNKIFPSVKLAIQENEKIPNENIINLAGFCKPREKKVIDQISHIIETGKPDLVQMEFVDVLDLSLCIPKKIKKIFVHHELRFMRIETELTMSSGPLDTYGKYMQKFCEITEIELLKNFDAIVTVSEDDKDLLLQKLPGKNICSLPFPILDKEIKAIEMDNLLIKKLVFVGGEFHFPNKDAVEWYISSMSKMIFEKYGFILHVIGNWSKEAINKYKSNPTICFTGFVDDLSEYCKNSIMIVPLRIGSGIRQKILYAMAAGIPVVSTGLGSEGIVDNDKISITANTPAEFVEAIDKIIADKGYSISMVSNAQFVLKTHYSQQQAGGKRFLFYKSVLEN